MRKVVCVGLCLAALLLCYAEPKENDIKTSRVVLYKQGLGYVEKVVTVDGDASIELIFDEKDIPDVLNSLVVVDLGGGTVTSIGYESKTPREKLLSEVLGGRDVGGLCSILKLFKGAEAHIATAGRELKGRIAGVEPYQKARELSSWRVAVVKETGEVEAFDIGDITSFRLLDASLQKDLQRYLKLYSEAFRKEQKKIVIRTKGRGKRRVFIAYTIELPVWKTTHRFIVRGDKALCQSWAVVDNTTMEEWKDVDMTLVCGVPVTFQFDIYSPLFTHRQRISPSKVAAAPVARPEPPSMRKADVERLSRKRKGYGYDEMRRLREESEKEERYFGKKVPPGARAALAMDKLASSVQAAIETATVSDYFIYNIAHKTTVGSKSSAMIPIVNKETPCRKVAFWRYGSGLVSPYQALEVVNETGLVLDGGPVTIFEAGNFLGNAIMKRLQTGEKTLLMYALDQSLKVRYEWGKETTSAYLAVAKDGYLIIKRWRIGQLRIKVENTSNEGKVLLLEYPKQSGWDVLNEKGTYTEKDGYLRFEMKAEPKKMTEFIIKLRRDDSQTFYLTNISERDIKFFFSSRWLNEKQKEQLMEIVRLRTEMQKIQNEMSRVQREIKEIFDDQSRLRENIKTLTGDSVSERELRSSYVNKFREQEKKLGELRGKLRSLRTDYHRTSRKLSEYVSRILFENRLKK